MMPTNKVIPIREDGRDYYCSSKFRFVKVDLENRTTYCCHAAKPHPIDFAWLEQNPGELFNTETTVNERLMMLDNVRNSSCEQNCWAAEDRDAVSPRIFERGYIRSHQDIYTYPEIVELAIGSECALSCSYCCKEYSSKWRNDILENGNYALTGGNIRYEKNNKDKLLAKISQPQKIATPNAKLLMKELEIWAPTMKQLIITGGEPFLNRNLLGLVKKAEECPSIRIISGLGVGYTRFERIVKVLSQYPNLELTVSCEGIGKFLEFNRYGTKWDEFSKKIDFLTKSGIKYRFQTTITNLSAFGLVEFYKTYPDQERAMTFVCHPLMMAPYVMDDKSKELILSSIDPLPQVVQDQLRQSMLATPNERQRINIGEFLQEFVRRRPDLSLSIFPDHFLTWAGIPDVV